MQPTQPDSPQGKSEADTRITVTVQKSTVSDSGDFVFG